MARFTIRGEVIRFSPTQRNIRVHNVEAMREYWDAEGIDTNLDWAGREVLATLGVQELINRCEVGDIVDYTIEPWNRVDGRRIRGVALEVVTPAAR